MTHNEGTETINIKKKSDLKEKLKRLFSLKMLHYTLIKMLKSPSTYIMFGLTFAVGLIMTISMGTTMNDSISGDYSEVAKSIFVIYSWIWYMLYFGLTSMFIGFKAVQLIRDEIEDGTLLIFSSIPISRTRMIIEKWLALQFLCLGYSLIILLVPPLISLGIGPKGAAMGKVIFSKINFMILTSIILQLFLTTIGILISLGLNAKGVIGILFTIGFLTIIGAMIPLMYNTSKIADKSSAYLMRTTDIAKSSIKFNDSAVIETYNNLLDPAGWPVWNYDNKLQLKSSYNFKNEDVGAFNVTNLANDIDKAIQNAVTDTGKNKINWDDFVAEVKKKPTSYSNLGTLINDYVLKLDGYNPKQFSEISNINGKKINFLDNPNKGINILRQFYQEISGQEGVTISSVKPSESKINLNVLDQSKLKTNSSKQIYKIMKAMYDKGIFSPTFLSYDYKDPFNFRTNVGDLILPNEITSTISGALSENSHKSFSNFSEDLLNFLKNNLYLQNLYVNDPALSIYYQFVWQMSYWLNQGLYVQYSDTNLFDNNNLANAELNDIKKAETQYKLMAYLNPWQQWVVMWTGDARGSLMGQDGMTTSMLLPVNNYLTAKINTVEYNVENSGTFKKYFLVANFNESVTLTSLAGMYAGYLLVTLGLAGLTLWWITRKDFV
ncbi:ABC transporter permease [Spiroplasma endosymbiont of Stenodema calcarata]|uniref:ABC transporter permease n=1 Tax=Spiroplasma endosymbiont of Stenodema calcarata TaxID=3139328 RepID=UPI003CCA6FAB